MSFWTPDPTFYPSARMAMQAPAERLAYLVTLNPALAGKPDALCVVDVDPGSPSYSKVVGRVEMPNAGDELHHFGWNACSSALCPYAPHPHVERRYLLVPGLRSSRLHVIDTKPDPRQPRIVKVIEPEQVAERAGYSRLHTVHCAPDGIYVGALGSPQGEGPGGIMVLDHDSFEVLGRWEVDRGPQVLAYDFAWHLGYDTLITSEWGTPKMVEGGLNPELLLQGKYGRSLHISQLPPALKPFGAVPPLVSDIELSLDDKFLYVSCWGTGELKQYDVSDPFNPRPAGSVRLGGIVKRAPHEKAGELNGGPQMVEVSRDGRRVYLTNSLYASWDAQFYPDGIRGWMAKIDADPEGGIAVDPRFFVAFDGERPHQVRLEGGDASSDSYCYP